MDPGDKVLVAIELGSDDLVRMVVGYAEVVEEDMMLIVLNEKEENIVELGGVAKPQKGVLTIANQGTTFDFHSHLHLKHFSFIIYMQNILFSIL